MTVQTASTNYISLVINYQYIFFLKYCKVPWWSTRNLFIYIYILYIYTPLPDTDIMHITDEYVNNITNETVQGAGAVRLNWSFVSWSVTYVDGYASLCSFVWTGTEAGSGTECSPGQSHRSCTHSWHAACWVAKADGDRFFVLSPQWLINTSIHNLVHTLQNKLLLLQFIVCFNFSATNEHVHLQAIENVRVVFMLPEAQSNKVMLLQTVAKKDLYLKALFLI